MSYSYKCYSDTKEVMKKYVNATEGSIIYGISKTHLMTLVNDAGALYKVGNTALINTEIFEAFAFWFVILFSCLKVAARADRIMEAFLLGEEEYFGNQSEKKQIKEAG